MYGVNIGCNALETMVAMLEYRKVCARWVPRMLTQEHKEHRMQVCQDLLNQYEAEGDSFLDRIITGDETWCHHYEPESKRQSMEWRPPLVQIFTSVACRLLFIAGESA